MPSRPSVDRPPVDRPSLSRRIAPFAAALVLLTPAGPAAAQSLAYDPVPDDPDYYAFIQFEPNPTELERQAAERRNPAQRLSPSVTHRAAPRMEGRVGTRIVTRLGGAAQ